MITLRKKIMLIIKNNKIISLSLKETKNIGNNFLRLNRSLTSLNLPKVENIGNSFLYLNNHINRKDYANY